MELVRACSLTGYFAVAEQLGLDVTPLLRRAGLTRSMMSNPEQMLPARSVVQLLEDSASASGCITFGLRMAAERRVSDIGKVSLLIVHQPTLRDSLDVLSEFRNRLNSHLTLQIEEHGDTVFLRQHFALNPPMVSRQVNDAALGVHYNLCRTMMGDDWRPQCVFLSYERPMSPDRAIYERLFRLPNPVRGGFRRDPGQRERHGAPASRMGCRACRLRAKTRQCDHRPGRTDFSRGSRTIDPAAHARRRASFAGVADALGTNVRTLQRHLEREGTSFSDLLDRVRVQQVSEHFANRRLRLTDVADLLGYSTLASFSTWYRSRFHETPTTGRRRLQRDGTCEKGRMQTFA